MNKEQILARIRAANEDEGMQQAENNGRKIGFIAFCFVFIFIILFSVFNGQHSYAPYAMFWAFMAAEAYPKYRFTKKKVYLLLTIAGSLASIASLANFILNVLR